MINACPGTRALRLALLFVAATVPLAAAAEAVDFSCISHQVRGKTPLTDRYKEYDVVLSNHCPGPVYWSMCIERLDPVSHDIVETHTPSGYLEADKRSRVNLQMKTAPDSMRFRPRYQSFYLGLAYGIDGAGAAPCDARRCESGRDDLRRRVDANLAAWARAKQALAERLAERCPESGWGKTEQSEACERDLREAAQPELEQLAASDAELQQQLQAAGGPDCRIYAGDLITR